LNTDNVFTFCYRIYTSKKTVISSNTYLSKTNTNITTFSFINTWTNQIISCTRYNFKSNHWLYISQSKFLYRITTKAIKINTIITWNNRNNSFKIINKSKCFCCIITSCSKCCPIIMISSNTTIRFTWKISIGSSHWSIKLGNWRFSWKNKWIWTRITNCSKSRIDQ